MANVSFKKIHYKPKMAKNKIDVHSIEKKWKEFWEREKLFKFDPNSGKEIYSFDIPPPTISGRLHMGHAFGDAQQDFFVRFRRMQGYEVLNPFGTDNNGLPTLKLVEKEKDISSKDMKREEFIDLCQKTIEEKYIPQFLDDVKNLGVSADFDLFYSTIDERSRRISQWSFIDLYNKGREYRVESPALWCPKCQTTIAQFELEDKEVESSFNDIVFKIDTGEGEKDKIISTTRPELLPACVAVFVNPEDEKNKHLIGNKAKVPLYDFEVPVLGDENADPEKGSGVVMCCTFGDQTDMEWQKSHNLPIKMAIDPSGKMTSLAGEYEGLSIKEAREKIIQDLKSQDLLKDQRKITHSVNVHERCDTEVEFIKTKQWFVKYLDLKEEMYKWAEGMKWHPEFMKTRYDNWVEGLKWDWCISRQIPFGIPFPVWYCKNPECEKPILAKEEDLPVDPIESQPPVDKCPHCGGGEFEPETDVMNTWATSALTPTIIKDLVKEKRKEAYEKIKDKPMNIRRNAQDIITFWDFNTMVKSYLHFGINPWEEVYINGWMLGRDGRKMSKSKGNGINPQEVIDEHGADALRYLSASIKPGSNAAFSDKELILAKKLYTKLFNATKFVFMNLEDYNKKDKPEKLETTDKLFLNKLNNSIERITNYFENYQPSLARDEFDRFFWNMFCDNYLEIVKKRVYNAEKGSNEKVSAQYTLYQTLLALVKMLAPIMPFTTEEVYQNYFYEENKGSEKDKSVHISQWPEKLDIEKLDDEEKGVFDTMLEVIGNVRQKKTENQKSMKAEIVLYLSAEEAKKLQPVMDDLKAVTNASEVKELSESKNKDKEEKEFDLEFVE